MRGVYNDRKTKSPLLRNEYERENYGKYAEQRTGRKDQYTEILNGVVNVFAEHAIDVTEEQLEKAIEMTNKVELSEENLDDVRGGFVSGTAFLIESILYSVGCIAWAAYSARRR